MDLVWILLGVIVVLEVIHYRERKDLYSRLMAKSLPEFTAMTEKKAKVEKPRPPDLIQI